MKETKVSILNDSNEELVGIETLPSIKKEKYPTVILVHGFGVTKEEYGMFDGLAKTLAEAGIANYRFDFSGRGESKGDYAETSITKMKEELTNIIDFVKEKDFVGELGLLAQSFGTTITIALHPDVKTIVLMGTLGNPKILYKRPDKWQTLDLNGVSIKVKKTSGEIIKINKEFWQDIQKYNLSELIKEIKCPILFIHGSEDTHVPLSEMESLYTIANNAEKIILKGAPHGMEKFRDKVNEIAVDWFSKKLF